MNIIEIINNNNISEMVEIQNSDNNFLENENLKGNCLNLVGEKDTFNFSNEIILKCNDDKMDDFVYISSNVIGGDNGCTVIGGDNECTVIGGDNGCTVIGGDNECTVIGGDNECTVIGGDNECHAVISENNDENSDGPYFDYNDGDLQEEITEEYIFNLLDRNDEITPENFYKVANYQYYDFRNLKKCVTTPLIPNIRVCSSEDFLEFVTVNRLKKREDYYRMDNVRFCSTDDFLKFTKLNNIRTKEDFYKYYIYFFENNALMFVDKESFYTHVLENKHKTNDFFYEDLKNKK